MATEPLGISGRIARRFQNAQITPLLGLVALLLGLFAIIVTPRDEDPQINVTMANVLIPFPGASAREVERMVASPAEQVLSQMTGIKHVMSVSRPGLAIITVQFKVGVPHIDALVRLYNTLQSNRDWLPRNLGVLEPIVKPKGIDDVPIVTLTLYSRKPAAGAFDLARVAHTIEADLKRVPGTREVTTIGGPGHVINIELDPVRMRSAGVTVADLRAALQSANMGEPIGHTIAGNASVTIDTGPFLKNAADVASLVVGTHDGRPIFLDSVAKVIDGPEQPRHYVWFGAPGKNGGEFPAVTLTITKKAGENAVKVAGDVIKRVNELKNTLIPANVTVAVTRDYGLSAEAKAMKLIEKLLFATVSVVALVFFALGRREAAIVGVAVALTLTTTLFASWAWGFTLNRVSLFALIFSIGILVDDAIVVVENIHRHKRLEPHRPLLEIIPQAVDEVGGPTILATMTVIAALLPMAFVSGLMGPYMSPIPINASMGMMISLTVAFVVTPWLAHLLLEHKPTEHTAETRFASRIGPFFRRVFRPFLDDERGGRNRLKLWASIAVLIAGSLALPAWKLVILKMLPFDNKSEFEVIVNMPAGTPVEQTAALLHEMGAYLDTVPQVVSYQAYAGVAAPINFNGLVRQYYLRSGGDVGELHVNLLDKAQRSEQSHEIAQHVRPALDRLAKPYHARIAVVEVPPGPPVLAPIVAEIYGPNYTAMREVARQVLKVFESTPHIVDVDTSMIASAPRKVLVVDRRKAALLGISQQELVSTLRAGLAGETVTYLHDQAKYPVGTRLELPVADKGSLHDLLQLSVRSATGHMVPVRELVSVKDTVVEQPIYHKDLLPVVYVTGDVSGKIDSPLYGMFAMRSAINRIKTPDGGTLHEHFVSQPSDPYSHFSYKWDGEWQITYETFRDMGIAYAVGLVLIYLLVVAEFGSYLTPLIIMAPIPLTIIGVMPGHALLHAQFTATSMIGMIALAGIIVRNSILLVDFINLELAKGADLKEAIVRSAIIRAQPIVLTAVAAMLGAFFILDDPIFNGLAISLIFGIFVSTVLTLLVIPLLYYTAYHKHPPQPQGRHT